MTFDFKGRFQNAFGYVNSSISRRLASLGFDVSNDKTSNRKLSVYSWNNDTTFDEVTLRRDVAGVNESYLFGYSGMMQESLNVFAPPPMLSLKRSKKIATTTLDGDSLECVERYNTEPYDITWRGLLIDMDNHEFPLDKLESINRIFEVNGVWNVDSEILNRVGVNAIYIKDIDIDFVEGYEDTIQYTLTARAIKPLEYQLIIT